MPRNNKDTINRQLERIVALEAELAQALDDHVDTGRQLKLTVRENAALKESVRWTACSERLPDHEAALMWSQYDGFPVIEIVGIDEWPQIVEEGDYTHWIDVPLPPVEQGENNG